MTGQVRPETGELVPVQVKLAAERGCPDHDQYGPRLAALVDGELDHDARERVLAHLAGCESCRAEAEGQRCAKSTLRAETGPGPSAELMARLLALPGSLDDDRHDDGSGTPRRLGGVFGGGRSAFGDGFQGFPTHQFGAHHAAPDRAASQRGRRFAIAAAGAFSVAAMAIGTAVTVGGTAGGTARGGGGGGRIVQPASAVQIGPHGTASETVPEVDPVAAPSPGGWSWATVRDPQLARTGF